MATRKTSPKRTSKTKAAASRKATVSKSAKFSPRRLTRRVKLLFVALFALVGGAILYASFADTTDTFLVGMGTGGAISATQDADGNVTYSGDSLSFQVTPDNLLQCTGAGNGKITTAQLTPQQTSDIANQVIAAGIQSQSDTVVAKGEGSLTVTWVTVNTNGVNKTVNIAGQVESTPFGRAISAIARDACKQATTPAKHQTSAATKKLDHAAGVALAQKVENMLNPKVYASGYGPRMETAQYNGVNYWRDTNGVSQNLRITTCLRDSARAHSALMAKYNSLSHQLPGEPNFGDRINAKCGAASWNHAGENVAYNPDMSLDGVAQLVDLMATEKPGGETGHRENILSTTFTNIGAGAYFDDTNGKIWITEDFATFNNKEALYAPTSDWNLNGSAKVSLSTTTDPTANVYVKPGQTVYYYYRIANTGPSQATYTQYRIWKQYAANGTVVSTTDAHGQSTVSTGWGYHGDNWPGNYYSAGTYHYAFSGRYYDDFTVNSVSAVIPSTAQNGEKYCRAIHYGNATGPGTSAETSNYACAIVKI